MKTNESLLKERNHHIPLGPFNPHPKTKEPATAQTRQLIESCRQKGLLMIAAGTYSNIIRLLMPLVITDEQLENGLDIIEEGLKEKRG